MDVRVRSSRRVPSLLSHLSRLFGKKIYVAFVDAAFIDMPTDTATYNTLLCDFRKYSICTLLHTRAVQLLTCKCSFGKRR